MCPRREVSDISSSNYYYTRIPVFLPMSTEIISSQAKLIRSKTLTPLQNESCPLKYLDRVRYPVRCCGTKAQDANPLSEEMLLPKANVLSLGRFYYFNFENAYACQNQNSELTKCFFLFLFFGASKSLSLPLPLIRKNSAMPGYQMKKSGADLVIRFVFGILSSVYLLLMPLLSQKCWIKVACG